MENEIKDGGAAFPGTQYANGISPTGHSEGMTLRDYFAAKVLSGIMSNAGALSHFSHNATGSARSTDDKIASAVYAMADAMLAAREGKV